MVRIPRRKSASQHSPKPAHQRLAQNTLKPSEQPAAATPVPDGVAQTAGGGSGGDKTNPAGEDSTHLPASPVHAADDTVAFGPYDAALVDPAGLDFSDYALDELDLGSLVLPLGPQSQVQIEMAATGPKLLHIVNPYGRITPVAFAAAVGDPHWDDQLDATAKSMRADGLTTLVEQGPWGRELVGEASGVFFRVIGINGPRWMVRFTIAAPAEYAAAITAFARETAARTMVYRGTAAIPARQPLPVTLPEHIAHQIRSSVDPSVADHGVSDAAGSSQSARERLARAVIDGSIATGRSSTPGAPHSGEHRRSAKSEHGGGAVSRVAGTSDGTPAAGAAASSGIQQTSSDPGSTTAATSVNTPGGNGKDSAGSQGVQSRSAMPTRAVTSLPTAAKDPSTTATPAQVVVVSTPPVDASASPSRQAGEEYQGDAATAPDVEAHTPRNRQSAHGDARRVEPSVEPAVVASSATVSNPVAVEQQLPKQPPAAAVPAFRLMRYTPTRR
ncbi:DUF3710 domain-containing protein [Corynebacterium choanae]|uniref:DUF3710 domain-containing protein n=1 Tax=Corynebacterium choanae TaxID=1862358 RepID=A0A3G6J6M9_9CORY|nr:DUF3710 domain-containing protein [Corynebacterium choanae]AZA13727.1 hypothetical protein CCHOA_06675 [Corynebacterium choanae]